MNANRKDLRAPMACLQHRHFATIAAIIRDFPNEPIGQRFVVAQHFARELGRTNPRFDRGRFIAAALAHGEDA